LLPDADHVPRWVAERRYAQIAFRIRRRHDLPALSDDLLQRLIDPLDEHIGQDARLSGYRQIRHEVSDHMTGSILEARIVPIGVHSPAEYRLIEGRRTARLRSRDPQIRDPAPSEYARLFPSTSTQDAIMGQRVEAEGRTTARSTAALRARGELEELRERLERVQLEADVLIELNAGVEKARRVSELFS